MQIHKYLKRVLFLGQTKQIYLVDLFAKKNQAPQHAKHVEVLAIGI